MEMDAAMLAQLMAMMARVEAKIDLMLGQTGAAKQDGKTGSKALGQLTVKQHAVLQMLLNGKSNAEIADRLGVNENTAKVHVRLIAKKLGVSKRQEIVAAMMEAFRQVPDKLYLTMSRGLPKNWDEEWGSGTEKYDSIVRSE